MMGITHAFFGAFCSLLYVTRYPGNEIPFVALAVLAAIFPDIDESRSIVGKRFLFLPLMIKHRGITHTPFLMLVIAGMLYVSVPLWVATAVVIGYTSHLVLDTTTYKGIMWFWPSEKRIKGPLKTGKIADTILLLLLMISTIALGNQVFLN